MLFFEPVLVILVFYFGYFLEIQWYLSKLKKCNFAILNLGQEILGKQLF